MASFPFHTRLSGGGGMGRRKRRRMDSTDDWRQLELLCVWEEQREYERIRPLVLFGGPVLERAAETGSRKGCLRNYDDRGTPTRDHAGAPRDQDRASVRGTAQRTPPTRR